MEGISEVWGGEIVQSFVGDEKNLGFDALLYREPVKETEDGSDMLSGAGVDELPGGWIN